METQMVELKCIIASITNQGLVFREYVFKANELINLYCYVSAGEIIRIPKSNLNDIRLEISEPNRIVYKTWTLNEIEKIEAAKKQLHLTLKQEIDSMLNKLTELKEKLNAITQ